jgi:hypothetical protein
MGIEELILDLAEKRGLEKGEEKKSHIIVENLIVKMGLSDEQAADLAEVPLDFVAKVRLSLGKR